MDLVLGRVTIPPALRGVFDRFDRGGEAMTSKIEVSVHGSDTGSSMDAAEGGRGGLPSLVDRVFLFLEALLLPSPLLTPRMVKLVLFVLWTVTS